jgi:two-component system sensor histidine kinase KdpD
MFFFRYRLSLEGEHRRAWGQYARDIVYALLAAIVLTIPLFLLHMNLATVLFGYLLIVLGTAYLRGFRVAMLMAFLACFACDFLFITPANSLFIKDVKDLIGLLTFLLVAILLSFLVVQQQEYAKRVKRQQEEEQQRHNVEVSRLDQQVNAYWEAMQKIREEKDLQKQLALVARTIEEVFAPCGVRQCMFSGPDIDGRQFLHHTDDDTSLFAGLSSQEEDSAMWVMEHGQSVVVRETPLIARAMGSFARRVVASNISNSQRVYRCSYLVPLLSGRQVLGESGQRVLGVMHLLIEDSGHPDLQTIKRRLEMRGAASPGHEDLFSQLLGHATNLVEQALIERALMERESQNQELQRRSDELRSTIISSVSHDFHTPLTLIKGVATSLQVQDVQAIDAAEHRQMLELVVSEVDWLERMVMKMLDFSRIERGALKLEKELYPIDGIIQTTLDRGHMRSLLAGRSVVREVPDELTPVEVDPLLIEHVLVNLLENAVRYTPKTSPIAIRVREIERRLVVSVADGGPGIPEHDLERIFESFYSVKPCDKGKLAKAQGSGLGLAICRGFVEAHGGSIWAENRPEGGAVIQFTLPLPVIL